MSATDTLKRRVIPRAIVTLSQVDAPARAAAAVRRTLGGAGRVELFVAFDDPYSAIALLGLRDRLRGRRAGLVIEPVVGRGIPGDPAVELKRAYAVEDARRLARRDGRELSRSAPVAAADAAFLARWTASIPAGESRVAFGAAAMQRLWFEDDGPLEHAGYAELFAQMAGTAPPGADDDATAAAVQRAERLMRRRGPYDTPAAIVSRQWFFAHERLAQIEHRLDRLGWTAGA